MSTELTTEEIVTNLLVSEEILKTTQNRICTSTKSNLGNFLITQTEEKKPLCRDKNIGSKYSFIKNGYWKF